MFTLYFNKRFLRTFTQISKMLAPISHKSNEYNLSHTIVPDIPKYAKYMSANIQFASSGIARQRVEGMIRPGQHFYGGGIFMPAVGCKAVLK